MAKFTKSAMGEFPMDVNFLMDAKMLCITEECGAKGIAVALALLCAVYREGYFLKISEGVVKRLLLELPFLSGKEELTGIIEALVLHELFDAELFEKEGVLTSVGVQKRYFASGKCKKEAGELKYLLVKVPEKKVRKPKNVQQEKVEAEGAEAAEKGNTEIALSEPEVAEPQPVLRNWPPYIDDIEEYARELNTWIKPEDFWNYQVERGWFKNGAPLTNWKQEFRRWETKGAPSQSAGQFGYPYYARRPKVTLKEGNLVDQRELPSIQNARLCS